MKNTRILSCFFAVAAMGFTPVVGAATWYYYSVTSNSVLFFDKDSVIKNAGNVTLWEQSVRLRTADEYGDWSGKTRWQINCTAKTVKMLQRVDYGKEGNVTYSSDKPSSPSGVIPETIGEYLVTMACKPNFPNDKSGKSYEKIPDNDVLKYRDYTNELKEWYENYMKNKE